MKKDGKLVRKEAVKICDIPDTAELKWDKNSDHWLEGIPKGQHEMKLTFKETVNVVTNSIRIDDKSLTVHQYTFDIFVNEEDKENTVDSEPSTNPFINNNNNTTKNENGIKEMQSKPKINREKFKVKANLSEEERRNIFNKFCITISFANNSYIFTINK